MASMSSEKSSSSSPSSITRRLKWDVFLYSGVEDSCEKFRDRLHTALKLKEIDTRINYKDERELSDSPDPATLEVIEESRSAVIIISRKYLSSEWCLNVLVACMKETGPKIVPIFYNVDPNDVREQKGVFANSFAKHEELFEHNLEMVERWRDAFRQLTNLFGWHLQNRHEPIFIRDIVGRILALIRSFPSSSVPQDLVGIDSRVEEILNSYLRIGMFRDVRFMGICGMGGMGKSTLARAIFDELNDQFEASTFLADIRERVEKHDLVHLQREFLSDILMENSINIGSDVNKGKHMIKNRLNYRKVLIVLDGVDKPEQLEVLAGRTQQGTDWFGAGSVIIITARDKHLLIQHGVAEDEIYEPKKLNDGEALQLFSRKAFKNDHPPETYLEMSNTVLMEMSNLVLKHANGLPLTLEVLGSSLFGRGQDFWKGMIGSLKNTPFRQILDTLQISFDGLEKTEKNMFLDIACFFKGMGKDRVASILRSCGYHPDRGIEVLKSKFLVTISENKLSMHDSLVDLGREIVHRESNEPGKRSRLWDCDDACRVLRENEGTDLVEGIFLNHAQQEEVPLNPDAFLKMTGLRFLKICNMHLPRDLNYLSNELRVIEWHGYPSTSLPMNFRPDKLVELNMRCSGIEQLRDGVLSSDKLKLIDLSDSQNLIKTPDFTEVPNLERLILQSCTKLSKVHPSIGVLIRLIHLDLKDCDYLNSLPGKISLESLKVLILSGCSRLEKFPEIEGNMTHLSKLYLDRTAIKDLPISFELLIGLTLLSLRDCKNLSTLPSVVCSLTSLKTLTLSGCSNLDKMPENLGNMKCLGELDASKTALRHIPPSILHLNNLKNLSFHGCKGPPPKSRPSLVSCCLFPSKTPEPICLLLPISFSGLSSLESLNLSDCNLLDGAIPNDLSGLSSLQSLDLSGNDFASLPDDSLWNLSNLTKLNLRNCSRLRSLPVLPSSSLLVDVRGCTSLETTYEHQMAQD